MSFWNAWELVKDKIDILLDLERWINAIGKEAAIVKGKANKIGDTKAAEEADKIVKWANKWYLLARDVSSLTRKYHKKWFEIADTTPEGEEPEMANIPNFQGFGAVFSSAVITAIITVAAFKTFTMIKEGKFQFEALQLVAKKVISPREFNVMVKNVKTGSVGTELSSIIRAGGYTAGTVFATPLVAVGGMILIYLFMKKKK